MSSAASTAAAGICALLVTVSVFDVDTVVTHMLTSESRNVCSCLCGLSSAAAAAAALYAVGSRVVQQRRRPIAAPAIQQSGQGGERWSALGSFARLVITAIDQESGTMERS